MLELDFDILIRFLLRFFINILTLFVLTRFIFYPKNGQRQMIFTYNIVGLVVFLIGVLMDRIGINMGLALGLFAIFSIIRFRTPPIEAKELSYLFLVVGISIINALVDDTTYNLAVASVINVFALLMTFFLESYSPKKKISKKPLTYVVSELELLNNKKLLLNEIIKKTGLNIFKIEVRKINTSKKELNLWVYYKEQL